MESKRHVLIIGGGICGPALGLFLNKAGISSTIYEAYPYTQRVGGGLNLAPNGTYVIKQLGLYDTVMKKGTPVVDSYFKNDKGKLLATVRAEAPWIETPAVSMSRGLLFSIFAEELKQRNISIHYEKKLTSITHTADKVIAHFADGTTAEGDLLVGADGVNSIVRKHILPNGPDPKFTNLVGIGGFTPIADLTNLAKEDIEAISFIFGAKGFFGYGGADTGLMMWWSNIVTEKEYTREEMLNPNCEDVKQELLTTFKDFQPVIPELIAKTTTIIRHNIKDIQSLPTWYKDRIVLIGDAAHAVSPNSGQGASLALEDAMMLAKLLRDNEDHVKAFKTFQDSRKDRVEKIVAEGRRRGEQKTVVSPFKAKMREWMISIFVKLFGVKGMKLALDYKIDWEKKE